MMLKSCKEKKNPRLFEKLIRVGQKDLKKKKENNSNICNIMNYCCFYFYHLTIK